MGRVVLATNQTVVRFNNYRYIIHVDLLKLNNNLMQRQ